MAETVDFPRRGVRADDQESQPRERYQRRQDGQRPQRSQQQRRGDGKSWAEWKQELSEAIEQLDYACAEARQIIYKLRPLVRPKGERSQ